MSTKSIIFFSIIFLSIISRISAKDVIIPKYGKITIYAGDKPFLDVSDFDSGEKIYISITTTNPYGYYTSKLYYRFYSSINGITPTTTYSNYVYESSSTSSYDEETYNYKITKDSSSSKYLYLDSDLPLPIIIENTEDDASTSVVIIVVVVVCVVVLIVAIIMIVYCCRRCRRRRYATVAYPGVVGYGVSTFGVQPVVPVVQPVVQPVGVAQPYYNPSPQYNQVAPAPIGSDVRVNQNVNYIKPV